MGDTGSSGFWDVADLALLMKRLMRIPMDELP